MQQRLAQFLLPLGTALLKATAGQQQGGAQEKEELSKPLLHGMRPSKISWQQY